MLRIHLLTAAFALCTLVGCGETSQPEDTEKTPPPADSTDAGHGHSHGEGPNGGVIADWGGGKFHVEFTVDHDTKIATVYILDNNAKNPAPIDSKKLLLNITAPVFQVELMPVPLEGEAEGTSSRFIGKNDKLGTVQEFAGTISGEADGTPYAGDFKEEAHSH